MSFYGSRMSGFGAHLYADGAPVFFNPRIKRRMSGYGVLPTSLEGGGHFASVARDAVAQLYTQATQIQGRYLSLFQTPEGASAYNTAKSIEDAVNSAWADVLKLGEQYDALGPMPTALPSAEYEFIKATKDAGNLNSHYADAAASERIAAIDNWTNATNALNFKLQQSLVPKLRDYLQAYVTNVPAVASDLQAVIDAKIKNATATIGLDTAQQSKATQDLRNAEANLAKSKKAATASIGPSPLMIAAVAIPVVGLAAWFLLRKKKPASVGRYHKRRSRR